MCVCVCVCVWGGLNVGSGLFFLGGGVLSLRDFLRFPVLPHSIIPVT